MRQITLSQTVSPHITVLGIPIAGALAAFGFLGTLFHLHRSRAWTRYALLFVLSLSAFALGGSLGLAHMRTEYIAYFNEADCAIQSGPDELERVINATVFIDVLQESIGDTRGMRTLLVSATPWSKASTPLVDAQGNAQTQVSAHAWCAEEASPTRQILFSTPHVYVVDGFKRLIEIRAIKTTE